MDIMTIFMVVGVVLMLAGCIPHLGTSKAERMGKVAVDDKKKTRINLGYIMMAAGVAVCILGVIIAKIAGQI